MVRDVASPDVGRMGIEILSFTIRDVSDAVDYLDSLGKTQTAKVGQWDWTAWGEGKNHSLE